MPCCSTGSLPVTSRDWSAYSAHDPAAKLSAAARIGGDLHPARGGGAVRARGHPVFRRQGFDRGRPPRPEGLPPGPDSVSAAAHRHRAQLRRDAGLPGCAGRRHGDSVDRETCSGFHRRRPRAGGSGTQPEPEQPADDYAARRDPRVEVVGGHWRRPAGRGEGAGQGARLLTSQRRWPLGSEESAPRAVAPAQRPDEPGRALPRLPPEQLDRARRVALHRERAPAGPVALLRTRTRCRHARGGSAREHAAHCASARRRGRTAAGAFSHGRRRHLHRRGRIGSRDDCRRDRRGRVIEPDRTRYARRRSTLGGGHGRSQTCRILLMIANHAVADDLDVELLRLSTAGSVDDGKSTLIGRLLYDTKSTFHDQIAAVTAASLRHGDSQINLAWLIDGLRAEREQNITIDVAYRHFATPKRRFIIADTPGHIQYTRNMATGASTADLTIILIDARRGVVTQSKRHAFIASLLRIAHVVVAINKMDLVGYAEKV